MMDKRMAGDSDNSSHSKKLLVNRYKILERIDTGSMGSVYKAYDTQTDHLIAIKKIHSLHPGNIFTLKNEFRLISNVSHNHLVIFYELFVCKSTCFFTMELLSGTNILESVRKRTDFSFPTINYELLRKILIQLTSVIRCLHNNGILHMDIKPEHLLIDENERVILLDLGLATRFCDKFQITQSIREVKGTFAYMSPEILQGHQPLPASDWYSVGAVLYECLTGKIPNVILGLDPTPPTAIVAETPEDLNCLALALLHPDKRLRYSGLDILSITGKTYTYSGYHSPIKPTVKENNINLLGRIKELFQLKALLSDTLVMGNKIVSIQGAPGIGKTALAEHFIASSAREQNALIFHSKCSPFENIPLNAIDGILDQLQQHIAVSNHNHASTISIIRDSLVVGTFPTFDSVIYLAEILDDIAKSRPVILLIDDFQYSDNSSVELITELFAAFKAKGKLLLLNIREGEDAPFQNLLNTTKHHSINNITFQTITLLPIDKEESEKIAECYLGTAHKKTKQIISESNGIPFFLITLSEFIYEKEWKVDNKKIGQSILSSCIYDTLSQLPDDAHSILKAVIFTSQLLDLDNVHKILNIKSNSLLRILINKHLLRCVKTKRDAIVVEPYHCLIEKTLLDMPLHGLMRKSS